MVHSCDKHPRLGFTSICCGCLVDYNNAVAELKKHRWIPVEERLPKKGIFPQWSEDVEVMRGKTFDIAYWDLKGEFWTFTSGEGHGQPVTHWRYVILSEGE